MSSQRASERERSAAITAQKHRERDELSKTLPRNVAISLAGLAAAQRRERLRGEIAIERQNLNERLRERRSVSWREFVRERASAGDEAAQGALRGLRYQDGRDRRRSERDDETVAGPDLSGKPTQTKLQNLAFRVRSDGSVAYHDVDDLLRREVIRDEGFRIVVREHSDDTIRAAMRLAAERWGGEITIKGNATFKERAMRIAVEYGVSFRNPSLKSRQPELKQASRFSKDR